MNKSIRILFWVRKSRKHTDGNSPIMVRITISGQRKDFSAGITIPLKQWNDTKNRIKGNGSAVTAKNDTLDAIETRLRKIFNRLVEELPFVTVHDVHSEYEGKNIRNVTLRQLITIHNEKYGLRTRTDRSPATLRKYGVTKDRVFEFLDTSWKTRDLPIRSLSVQFIQDFQQFLLTKHRNHHNTIVKHLKNLKRFVNYAIEQQWIERNPFVAVRCGYRETEQVILTADELERIYRKTFSINRLEITKCLFLLQCYTGLAYVDMARLQHRNLQRSNEGGWCLVISRTKTGVPAMIPLLDRAYRIISQLQPNHDPTGEQKLLPVMSNQKMNAYLKEIADMCGITKTLSTHVGRRTMATTVLLSNGVPIETISKILAHTSIKTTQIYARVKDVMVRKEMERVGKLFK